MLAGTASHGGCQSSRDADIRLQEEDCGGGDEAETAAEPVRGCTQRPQPLQQEPHRVTGRKPGSRRPQTPPPVLPRNQTARSSPVRQLACSGYSYAPFIAKPKAACELRLSCAVTSSSLGLCGNMTSSIKQRKYITYHYATRGGPSHGHR